MILAAAIILASIPSPCLGPERQLIDCDRVIVQYIYSVDSDGYHGYTYVFCLNLEPDGQYRILVELPAVEWSYEYSRPQSRYVFKLDSYRSNYTIRSRVTSEVWTTGPWVPENFEWSKDSICPICPDYDD